MRTSTAATVAFLAPLAFVWPAEARSCTSRPDGSELGIPCTLTTCKEVVCVYPKERCSTREVSTRECKKTVRAQ
jgi:hypothetical protein